MFDILGSDILVMQELKIQRKDLRDDMVLLDGWDCYFSLPKHKKGYSGVGIYTRNSACAPIKAEEGLLGVLPSPSGIPYRDLPANESIGGYPTALQIAELNVDPALLDSEGRCLILEFPAFVLLGVYSPANSNGLRDDFRYGFICALDCRIRNLIRCGKRVVLVGDLNVSRDELDSASAVEDIKKAGITHEDYISTPNRRIFNQLLIDGEVAGERDEGREHGVLWDTTRGFHKDRRGMYTHWEQKINARPGNYGSRIDFVLVCEGMREWVKDANIQEGLLGSDHCPVFVELKEEVDVDGKVVKLVDLMNPTGMFLNGVRLKDWTIADTPPFSAKRLPEFDKRRSIKSMFAAPKPQKSSASALARQTDAGAAEIFDISNASHSLHPQQGKYSGSDNTAKVQTSADSGTPLTKRKTHSIEKPSAVKQQKTESNPLRSKAQQSLKGFFQRKTPRSNNNELPASDDSAGAQGKNLSNMNNLNDSDIAPGKNSSLRQDKSPNLLSDVEGDQEEPAASAFTDSPLSPQEFSAKLAAAEQNQRSWSALFSRPAAPLCEGHNEPCKTMQTKKKGSNQGRSFWMCARPLGPSGNKERGTHWRCPTFIWCSDWQPKKLGEEVILEEEAHDQNSPPRR